MKRVYTLYRVSTKQQVDKAKNDIPMQRIECREFAQKQGWEIVKELEEKGVSGFKVSAADRDAIQDLKEAAEKKKFDVLLVYMFDRIGRIDDETPFVVEWFCKHGIEVWSVEEGEQRFDSHVDKLTNYIRFWQASGESGKTSMRIKTRIHQLRIEGAYTGGPVPYGYCLEQKGRLNRKGQPIPDFAIEPHEAEIVREIFRKTLCDGYGSHRMAQYLNNRGLRTHGGARFHSIAIIRILRQKFYCGYIDDETSEGLQNLKIIDLDVFNQVQSILDQRAEKHTEKRQIALRTQGEAMLSGNIFCAHCGGRLNVIRYKDHYTRKDGSEYSVNQIKYACYHKSRKLCDCEGQTTYLAERVDEIVSQVIRQLFATMKCAPQQERLEATLKHQIASNRAQQKKINHELEKRRSRLGKLQEEIANALSGESIYSPEDVAQAISKIKEGISALEQQLYDLENDAFKQRRTMQMITPSYNQFKSWAEEFDQASMEQKKMIACQLFKKIEVGRGYNVTFELNMTYQQFCSEWDGLATIFEQQDLIAQ